MSQRRGMLAIMVLLAGGAGLGLVAAARPWATVADPSSLAEATSEVSGGDLVAYATPVFLVALAAAPAAAVMRAVGRRIVGVVVAALGVALIVGCVRIAADLDGAARRWARVGDGVDVTTAPAWPIGTAVVALVVVVASVLIVVHAPRWPGLSAKYERPPGQQSRPDSSTTPPVDTKNNAGKDGNRLAWDALDRGDDPTSSGPS